MTSEIGLDVRTAHGAVLAISCLHHTPTWIDVQRVGCDLLLARALAG